MKYNRAAYFQQQEIKLITSKSLFIALCKAETEVHRFMPNRLSDVRYREWEQGIERMTRFLGEWQN